MNAAAFARCASALEETAENAEWSLRSVLSWQIFVFFVPPS